MGGSHQTRDEGDIKGVDKMDKEEVIKKLKKLVDNDDQEMAHVEADQILMDFLVSLGYEDIVNAYDEIGKWYA